MLLKVTAKRQVTFPSDVLEALGVKPGDRIELVADSKGRYFLQAKHIDFSKLGTLHDQIHEGVGPFDIHTFRDQTYDPRLRD